MENETQKLYSLEELGFQFNEKGKIEKFIEEKFIEKFISDKSIIRDEMRKFYIFNNIYWRELSEDELVLMLKTFMDLAQKYLWKPNYEKTLLHFMKLNINEVKGINSCKYIMSFRDFDFDFRKGTIIEGKDPKKYFTYAKDIADKDLEERDTPIFDSFMNDIVEGDVDFKRYLLQMMGILISGENRTNLVFMVFGNGANSKSVFSKLIEHLVGREFVASRNIETFTKQFGLEGLEDKKLVTCGESETSRPADFSMIKAISGNDTVQLEGKCKAIKSVELSLNFLFLTNKLYKIADKSAGVKRRLQVIEFKHQVSEDRRDPELFEKLKLESAGIFGKVLEAYSEMILDGKMDFKMSENVKLFTQNYIENYLVSTEKNNAEEKESCVNFLNEYFEVGAEGNKISKSKVYDVYCSQIRDISEEAFWKNIKDELDRMNVVIKRNGDRFLQGIKLREEHKHKVITEPLLNVRRAITFSNNNDLSGVI